LITFIINLKLNNANRFVSVKLVLLKFIYFFLKNNFIINGFLNFIKLYRLIFISFNFQEYLLYYYKFQYYALDFNNLNLESKNLKKLIKIVAYT
jgi:hypothetical protein